MQGAEWMEVPLDVSSSPPGALACIQERLLYRNYGGLRVPDSGFRDEDVGLGVDGVGFRVQGVECG